MIALSTLLAGSATAAIGGAGAAAAAGGAAAAGAGALSFSSMLSAGFGVASSLASIAQGNAQAAAQKGAAEFEELNASRELLQGRAEALAALEAGNDAVAKAQVAGFAAGLAGEGSVTAAKETAMREADFEIGMARDNAEVAAGGRRAKAAQLRSDAKGSQIAGWGNAFGTMANTVSRFKATG